MPPLCAVFTVRTVLCSSCSASRSRQSVTRRLVDAGRDVRARHYRILRGHGGLRPRLRRPRQRRRRWGASLVSVETWIAAVTAVGVMGYLLYTLIRPERF